MSAAQKVKWASWFCVLLQPVEAVFPCTTRLPEAVGSPQLVGFCDTSSLATCFAVYVVWAVPSGEVHHMLLLG